MDERALEFWRKRELTFPRLVRRMTPDDLDFASGAWAKALHDSQITQHNERGRT